jgi:N-acetylmuramoyl-L-alanine amidase
MVPDLLRRHGYEVPIHGDLDKATRNVVRVFQMRYRPAKFDGVPDAETRRSSTRS